MLLLTLSFLIQYDLLLLKFKFNKSFFKIFIIIAIGVTTKKNINPITTGEIIFPKNNPNLNHSLLGIVSIFEFAKPNIKNSNENDSK